MTMTTTLFLAVCFVLACAHHVEPRRHPEPRREYNKLFVFGDTFADVGNLPKSGRSLASRQWYYPYGMSDAAHENNPTGRLSNGLIQADYMGDRESNDGGDGDDSFFGVNFAVGGAAACSGPPGSGGAPSLGVQIDQLSRLVRDGTMVQKDDLKDSVALLAFSAGRDYRAVNDATSSDGLDALVDRVTDAIADGVRRLQDMGVEKVVVNAMPPLGCTPWQTFRSNYTRCARAGNRASDAHNDKLRQKLGDDRKHVLFLDINTVFTNLVDPDDDDDGSARQFKHKYTPCCDTMNKDPGSYCGQLDPNGDPLYTLCSNPDQYFYWDFMHPTQAAWKAVMKLLQGPIEEFLGISSWQ
ncbi:hypothetical protein ACP4OV_003894 [Aristida adscensionis]